MLRTIDPRPVSCSANVTFCRLAGGWLGPVLAAGAGAAAGAVAGAAMSAAGAPELLSAAAASNTSSPGAVLVRCRSGN